MSLHQLAFCSNILPGTAWSDHFQSLQLNIPLIKEHYPLHELGLRLSAVSAQELSNTALDDLKSWLDQERLSIRFINGFPYGEFNNAVVKDKVHQPDWLTEERLEYSTQLLHILKQLLPAGKVGGISTSPISYRPWHDDPGQQWVNLVQGARQIARWIIEAHQVWTETEKRVVLEIEPEPDGYLDDLESTKQFFLDYLYIYGLEVICSTLDVKQLEGLEIIKRHCGVCFDVCHFAVVCQQPSVVLDSLLEAGITVGRLQLSSALKTETVAGLAALAQFDEPRYLHQARVKLANERIKSFTDLGPALQWASTNPFQELRTHFHVPLFAQTFGQLATTQDVVKDTLNWYKQHPDQCLGLEIETYTWDVIPHELRLPLPESVARELNWCQQLLD